MLSAVIKITGVYLLIATYMFFFQRSFMYHPKYGEYSPENLPKGFEEILITTKDDLKLKAWIKSDEITTNKKVILYLHGNAGTLNNRSYKLEKLSQIDANIMIISYRGFSGNKGKPTEEGLYEDARAAISHLNRLGFKNSHIIIYGESIGSAIAIEVAQNNNFAGIILEAPFTSAVKMAKKLYPIFPTSIMTLDRYESDKKIQNIESAILIIHGSNDQLVPVAMGEKLDELATKSKAKELVITEDYHSVELSDNLIKKIANFVANK